MAQDFDDFFRVSYTDTVRGLERDGVGREEAHDAAQEAYVRAYARWWRVGHYREPAAWVRRVAVNVTRDQHRRRQVRDAVLPALATGPIADAADGADAGSDQLDDVVAALPEQQRRAVALYYGDGYSTEEAAARMGISAGAFRFHLSRARKTLKPRMAQRLGRPQEATR